MRKFLCLLAVTLSVMVSWSQPGATISGKVTDAKDGSPLSGASVTTKDGKIGVKTNADGTYTITVPSGKAILVFSYVGYQRIERSAAGLRTLDVEMKAADNSSSDATVVAYGVQKKSTITGAIAKLGGEQIENKPFTSVDKALQGTVAGLQSVASTGLPGSTQEIRIRGIGSITASSEPLWVIDGVPVNTGDLSRLTTTSNTLSSLNPNDIESISVLKDASAASVYGSRAANGVILVTTKKGKSGKTKLRADIEVGQNNISFQNDKYKPMNAEQYFTITREGLINAGIATPANVDAVMAAALGYGNGVDYNWLKGVTQVGNQAQYNLSASGGNEKTTFFLSGGYFKQQGTVIESELKRYTTNISLTNKATNRLTISVNANAGYVQQKSPSSGGYYANPVLAAYFVRPSLSPYNADGSLNISGTDFGGSSGNPHNPIAVAKLNKSMLKQLGIRGSVSGEYSILDNLKFTSRYGIDMNVLEEDKYQNPFHGDGLNVGGRAISDYTRYFNYVWTNFLDYKQNINKAGDIYANLKVGYEAQLSKSYLSNLTKEGFPPTTAVIVAAAGAQLTAASQTASDYSFTSVFSIANFSYKDRYVLSGSFRRDGSSRFGSNNRYGNFYSIGATWNADREDFMANVKDVSQLKLRISYGANGNAGIGNYDWRPLYGYGANYNQSPGSAPSNVGNTNLTWELNKPLNIGLDLGLFKSRLNFTVDYYVRKTSRLLQASPLSLTSGFRSIMDNVGSMENRGVEIAVNATPLLYKDFKWDVAFTFANNRNKVTSLAADNKDVSNFPFIYKVGYDFQTYYIKLYAGVDPANGDPLWYVDDTKTTTTNDYDLAQRTTNFGSASPKCFGSFTNTFTFKGFSLEAQFYYNYGNYITDGWSGNYLGSGSQGVNNSIVRQLDRWQKPGDITMLPKYVFGGHPNDGFSSFLLYKGDYIRLRNIQFGYELPKSLLTKLHITSARFYLRGTNLWTWVKDKNLGLDPEQGIDGQSDLQVFIPKTFTFGVNIGF